MALRDQLRVQGSGLRMWASGFAGSRQRFRNEPGYLEVSWQSHCRAKRCGPNATAALRYSILISFHFKTEQLFKVSVEKLLLVS